MKLFIYSILIIEAVAALCLFAFSPNFRSCFDIQRVVPGEHPNSLVGFERSNSGPVWYRSPGRADIASYICAFFGTILSTSFRLAHFFGGGWTTVVAFAMIFVGSKLAGTEPFRVVTYHHSPFRVTASERYYSGKEPLADSFLSRLLGLLIMGGSFLFVFIGIVAIFR